MRDYKILTDSSCDLEKNRREALDIDYLKMGVSYGPNKETYCDLDWAEFSPKEFYQMLEDNIVFKTFQINSAAYEEVFEKYVLKGLDVLYLACAGALSGSINSARLAADNLTQKYPQAKIYCMDTTIASLGLGILVTRAVQEKRSGKTIDEVRLIIDEIKSSVLQVGTVENLKYLQRAGRINGAAAFMCKIANIKPIVVSDVKGANISIAKVRGRAKSIQTCINYIKENIINPETQEVGIVHADSIDDAIKIKEILINQVGVKSVYINYLNLVLGATVGRGMIGIYFQGKPRGNIKY
ncbi:MAG: DegV family protein [Acholeplasmatales bacterium]|nr:DegV family protein [Acholeplasmatales bacterium]